MRAIKINTTNRSIVAIEIADAIEILEMFGGRVEKVTTPAIPGHVVLLQENCKSDAQFDIAGFPFPLAGDALIVRQNSREYFETNMELSVIAGYIRWL